MKKVSTTSQSVFDDPLFCPGDSFNPLDPEEYVSPVAKPHAVDLVNTLTISDEESFLSKPKPMQTKRTVHKSTTSDVPAVPAAKVQPPPVVPKVTQKQKSSDPLNVDSVLESDPGEDLFLPASGQKTQDKYNFEEELFGKPSIANDAVRSVKLGGSKLRLGTHDSDSDNEISDLGVGVIMEREELDFDMFGKSSVRQYEPMQTDNSNSRKEPTTSVGKDDLILESSDILTDFESMLSDKGTAKKATVLSSLASSSTGSSATAAKAVVVDNSYDIDAYISQQEEDGGGGLFD